MTDLFDQEEDPIAILTGPGGKFDRTRYKDEAEMYKDIAKSKIEADKFISVKNEQFDQLREDSLKWREEALAKANIEDYMTRMAQKDTTTTQVAVKPELDTEAIKKLATEQALSTYQQIEAQKKQESNFSVVENKLREQFGERAKEVLRERMNALNLTQEDVKFLAMKSPEALINTLGLNNFPKPAYDNLPRGSTNSDSFRPTTTLRDAVFYEDLRREKPKEYFSEKMSVQRIKDMDHPQFLKRYEERENSRAGGY